MADTSMVLFGGRTEYPVTANNLAETPGLDQGLYIVTREQDVEGIYEMLSRWFAQREDVQIVDYGTSDKQQGIGFLIMEWCECEPDQLFLDILDSEDAIVDYTRYSREVND
jgi:hypothetical protein